MIRILKLVRFDQWSKNTLIFLPILTSGEFKKLLQIDSLIGFFIFSITASCIYIVNDLIDYKEDRKHPTKKNRIIASHKISKNLAKIIAIVLFIVSIFMSLKFKVIDLILLYFSINFLYNFIFKKIKYIDVICLSLFYVTRVLYGGTFFNIDISYFLIIFSFLFFLSLAIVKRLNEIKKYKLRLNIYTIKDAIHLSRILHTLNFISISIFIYYIFSETISLYVKNSKILIITIPLIFTWVYYIIKKAEKGLIYDNIIKYILYDKKSLLIIFLTIYFMVTSQI